MDVHDLIISNSEILGGKPVFKGTRVPVSNLIEYIESGYTVNDFLLGFPTVKKTQVKQVLNLLLKHILISAKTKNTAGRTLRLKTKATV
jgi:uncharacterized protein (DUF433 family)